MTVAKKSVKHEWGRATWKPSFSGDYVIRSPSQELEPRSPSPRWSTKRRRPSEDHDSFSSIDFWCAFRFREILLIFHCIIIRMSINKMHVRGFPGLPVIPFQNEHIYWYIYKNIFQWSNGCVRTIACGFGSLSRDFACYSIHHSVIYEWDIDVCHSLRY